MPAEKPFAVSMFADIIVPSSVTKNSSLPSPRHRGPHPPSRDIGCTPGCTGNGRTYTSLRPDELELYAIQRPSGENAAFNSLYRVMRNSVALPVFSSNVQRSFCVSEPRVEWE